MVFEKQCHLFVEVYRRRIYIDDSYYTSLLVPEVLRRAAVFFYLYKNWPSPSDLPTEFY